MDIGECSKIHNLALRADFEQASKDKDFFFDLEVSTSTNYKFGIIKKDENSEL